MGFLAEFVRHPLGIGAIAPSGRQLARRMAEAADLGPGQVVVELGAGGGPITAALLPRVNPDRFVALEPNPALAASLRTRFPTARIDPRPAQDLGVVLRDHQLGLADRVVSSLPFALWPEATQRQVLDAVVGGMKPGGRFVAFGYLHSQVLPNAGRFRRLLKNRFRVVTIASTAWWNLPPALVWACIAPPRGREQPASAGRVDEPDVSEAQ